MFLFNKHKLILIIFFSLLIFLYLLIFSSLDINFKYYDVYLKKLFEFYKLKLFFNTGEYLFFFGIFLITIKTFTNKKIIFSFIYFLISLIWVFYYDTLTNFIRNLGSDSLAELDDFNFEEAKFFITTLSFNIITKNTIIKFFLILPIYIFLSFSLYLTLIFISKKFLSNNKNNLILFLSSTFILLSFYFTFYRSLDFYIKNSSLYLRTAKNFNNIPPDINFDNDLNIIVYIGESTSNLNMSLYGYPRKTTPYLDRIKDELIVYNNVFSDHTHTSPALLEALSIDYNSNINKTINSIYNKKRISIIDIFNKNDVNTLLVSNQSQSGTSNQTASIIFKNSDRVFSTESKMFGNNETILERPYDHIFFQTQFNKIDKVFKENKKNIVFLHSYAGHGPYTKYIPNQYKDRIDDLLVQNDYEVIFGEDDYTENLEKYDSSIRYIDWSIFQIINKIKKRAEPIIFLYFSDHGESVFLNKGHNSAEFEIEMAQIPFFFYFNDKAKEIYINKYLQYKNLVKQNNISLLSQLPYTLFDIYGNNKNKEKIIGVQQDDNIILVRDLPGLSTYVSLSNSIINSNAKEFKVESVETFKISNDKNKNSDVDICYHRSNTFAKIVRGSKISTCLELDIIIEKDEIYINHPPKKEKFLLKNIISIVNDNNLALWLDAKNLDSEKKCKVLYDFLVNKKLRKVLVEFPSYISEEKYNLKDCEKLFDREFHKNIYTSYYIPTNDGLECIKKYNLQKNLNNNKCNIFFTKLIKLINKYNFSDISFDSRLYDIISESKLFEKIQWNTWNINSENYYTANKSKLRMIILNNSDKNSY